MQKNLDFILREIYGKSILMPIRYNEASNEPIYFNETATLIWKLVDEEKDIKNLLNSIYQIYDLDSNSAEAVAINGFINQLIKNKLILLNEER